ncbi:MAG: hypothetical protein CSA62_00125 [Planctomycetota bacterium]|nr:MAG: hypothetical protein CSA62_00125 [Planctomycetota bacterium]
MLLPSKSSNAAGWWALAASVLLSMLLWPEAWFFGRSVYSTDAIFSSLPWAQLFDAKIYNPELGDQDLYFFGQLAAAVRCLHEYGVLPTWNPSSYSGVPLSGNVQLSVLDPLHLVLALFQPSGEPFSPWRLALGLTWTGIFRFVLCCQFSFLWLRQVCGKPWLSFFAAAAFAAGPYAALWWFSTPGQVLAFFPVALYGIERRLRGGSPRWLLLSCVGLAMTHYGGYPQSSGLLALFLLGYVYWHGERIDTRRSLLECLGVLIGAGLLALPQLLPFLLYVSEGAVSELRHAANTAQLARLELADWLATGLALGLVLFAWHLPQTFGRTPRWRVFVAGMLLGLAVVALRYSGSDGEGLYWLFPGISGHPLSSSGYVGERVFIETNQDHVGLLPLLLMLAALRGHASRVALFGLAASLVLASGAGVLCAPLRLLLPLLEPSRIAVLVPPLLSLGLVLAGRWLLACPDSERPRELQLAALAVFGFLLILSCDHLIQSRVSFVDRGLLPEVPVSSFFGVLRDDNGDFWAYSGLFASYLRLPRMGAGTVFALLTLFVCIRGAPRTRLFAKGLFAVAVLLLIWPGWGFQPSLAREQVFPQTKLIRYLVQEKQRDPELRIYAPNHQVLPGSTAAVYGLDRVLGVDGFDPKYYVNLACHLLRDPALADQRRQWTAERMQLGSPLFDLFSARLVVAKQGCTFPSHFVERFRGEGLVVAENPRALPRMQFVCESFSLEQPERILSQDLRRSVGLYGSLQALGQVGSRGEVRVLERRPNGGYLLEVESDGAGWLVIQDAFLPGRRARVDGEARELQRANIAFAALALAGGKQRVELYYEPPGLALGLYTMLLTLAGLLVLLLWPSLRPFATSPPASSPTSKREVSG